MGFKTLATGLDMDVGVEGRGGEEKGPHGYFHPLPYNPKIVTKAYQRINCFTHRLIGLRVKLNPP